MPISHGDHLFGLVKSLTKAEKRNFRLYARRIQGEGDAKFLQLFDLLERQKSYDEESIREKLPGTSKSQFSNLKRHLYQHILLSLRLIQIRKSEAIQVREWLDYAQILYGKGLYLQALKLLHKARDLAFAYNLDFLHSEVIEFEKRIESRHITRSTTDRMNEMTREALQRSRVNANIVALSNLKLLLQRRFINDGHVATPAQRREVETYFEEQLPPLDLEDCTFFEHIYWCQVQYWFAYLLLDFQACQRWAEKWVQLYQQDARMVDPDVDMYMRAIHHVLTIAYIRRDVAKLNHYLQEGERFRKSYYPRFNPNSKILSFLIVHQGRFNLHFLRQDYGAALELVPRTLARIRRYGDMVDTHKIFILYYKIAWTYLCVGQVNKALDFLNRILNHPGKPLRTDIQAYAMLLFLMAHYELGNYEVRDYRSKSTDRYLHSSGEERPLQRESLQFFQQLLREPAVRHPGIRSDFYQRLSRMQEDPEQTRDFAFLDLPRWLELRFDDIRESRMR